MKFNVGCWHCKKLERNREVTYLLEKGVVVETEVLVAAPLDLETDDEEEVFSFFSCVQHSPLPYWEGTPSLWPQ